MATIASDPSLQPLFDEAASLGIATRKNMTEATLTAKIAEAKSGKTSGSKSAGKAKRKSSGKTFLVYAVEPGSPDLAYIGTSQGVTAQAAVIEGVKKGLLLPDMSYIALPESVLGRAVAVEAQERAVKYVAKKPTTAAKPRRSKQAAKKQAEPVKAAESTSPATDSLPLPAPGEAAPNPFVSQATS